MSLNGKIAIVSGGSRGIGRGIVLSLASKGVNVAFTYSQNNVAAESVVSEANELPGEVCAYNVDIREQEQVKNFVNEVVKKWGTLDVIVNNAGIRKDKTLAFMSQSDWNDVIQTNLTGTFFFTQAGIFHLLKKKKGRVINISSISGINGIAGQVNYSSTKGGLFGFTHSLAKEVAPYGIQVNAIAPGGVETDMTDTMSEKDREKLIQGVPMGRMCTVEEISKIVLFLADQEACPDYMTGTIITLDGGMGL